MAILTRDSVSGTRTRRVLTSSPKSRRLKHAHRRRKSGVDGENSQHQTEASHIRYTKFEEVSMAQDDREREIRQSRLARYTEILRKIVHGNLTKDCSRKSYERLFTEILRKIVH
jgi:hypothetical protein